MKNLTFHFIQIGSNQFQTDNLVFTLDSGFRSQDNLNDVEVRKKKSSDSTAANLKKTIYKTLCDTSDEADNNRYQN